MEASETSLSTKMEKHSKIRMGTCYTVRFCWHLHCTHKRLTDPKKETRGVGVTRTMNEDWHVTYQPRLKSETEKTKSMLCLRRIVIHRVTVKRIRISWVSGSNSFLVQPTFQIEFIGVQEKGTRLF